MRLEKRKLHHLYAFIDNPDIVEFEKKDKDLYLNIQGVNYYYAVLVFFKYRYNGKEYSFACVESTSKCKIISRV